jgi:prolyl 4-hydroxylase
MAQATSLETRVREADSALVGGAERDPDPQLAATLYKQAAEQGAGAAAARLAMLTAIGVGGAPHWPEALDWLAHAAHLGDLNAQRQMAVLAPRRRAVARGGPRNVWLRLRNEIEIRSLFAPPRLKVVSDDPRILLVEAFLAPRWAKWLQRRAQGRLARGLINDAMTGETHEHPMRTANVAAFPILERDVVVALCQARAEMVTGVPVALHEAPNVISYLPGQQFEAHFDFFDPLSGHFDEEIAIFGQRVLTCVTYLSEGFDGGETDFPELGLKVKGRPGDCVLFANVDARGAPERRSLHAGLPPKSGRKWVLSQWLRNKPQALV